VRSVSDEYKSITSHNFSEVGGRLLCSRTIGADAALVDAGVSPWSSVAWTPGGADGPADACTWSPGGSASGPHSWPPHDGASPPDLMHARVTSTSGLHGMHGVSSKPAPLAELPGSPDRPREEALALARELAPTLPPGVSGGARF
jgi:hypothetical protein